MLGGDLLKFRCQRQVQPSSVRLPRPTFPATSGRRRAAHSVVRDCWTPCGHSAVPRRSQRFNSASRETSTDSLMLSIPAVSELRLTYKRFPKTRRSGVSRTSVILFRYCDVPCRLNMLEHAEKPPSSRRARNCRFLYLGIRRHDVAAFSPH